MKLQMAKTTSASHPDRPTPATAPGQSASEAAPGEAALEPYLDKHEVARRLGCTTRTVDNMMRRGMIPFYKLGYRVAFRWNEIQNHLAQMYRVGCADREEKADLTDGGEN
jgi:excisionase family DNA binding protein